MTKIIPHFVDIFRRVLKTFFGKFPRGFTETAAHIFYLFCIHEFSASSPKKDVSRDDTFNCTLLRNIDCCFANLRDVATRFTRVYPNDYSFHYHSVVW